MPTLRHRVARPLLGVAVAMLAACGGVAGGSNNSRDGDATVQQGDYLEETHEGITYWVYLPTSYRHDQPMPLVVFLHGALGDAIEQAGTTTGWGQLAEEKGFIAAFPQAPPPAKAWWFDDAANS